jgi:ribosomal protein L29
MPEISQQEMARLLAEKRADMLARGYPMLPLPGEEIPAETGPADFAVAPQNDLAAYLKTSDEIAERKAALRKEQFERNTARLDKMYAGPSRSQQLFALSQAFLQPINTGGGGFAQVLGNVSGALGATSEQMREAQQKRAMAAAKLQDTYAMQGVEGDEERLARQYEIMKLLKGQGGYSYQLDQSGRLREVPKNVARPTTEAEYDAIPVGAYYRVPSGPDAGNIIPKQPPQR